MPHQSDPQEKPSGLGWPVKVSRETSDVKKEELGKKAGLGWPT
jgi:hypothetical protein